VLFVVIFGTLSFPVVGFDAFSVLRISVTESHHKLQAHFCNSADGHFETSRKKWQVLCLTDCYYPSDSPGARFAKYLTTALRLSYDNAKVTIDLRQMTNLHKTSYKGRKAFLRYDSLAKL